MNRETVERCTLLPGIVARSERAVRAGQLQRPARGPTVGVGPVKADHATPNQPTIDARSRKNAASVQFVKLILCATCS